VAANLRRVKVPFGVTDLAQQAAVASLDAEPELLERIEVIVTERDRLHAGLRAQGWPIHDSEGNFVWLRTGDDTQRVLAILDEHGILVRSFPGEGIRITIGMPEANDRALVAAQAALPVSH
jgi:histidinol-phosphate aminotransferase